MNAQHRIIDRATLYNYYELAPSTQPGEEPIKMDITLQGDQNPTRYQYPHEDCIQSLLNLAHHATGHRGEDALNLQIKAWKRPIPNQGERIKEFIKCCETCKRYKAHNKHYLPAVADHVLKPLDKIQIDVLDVGNLPGANIYKFALVIIDINTGYADAYPLKANNSSEIALSLLNFCGRFSFPKAILSDQGAEFVNKIMVELVKITGINHVVSAPYYPQSHGRVERLNGSLRRCLNAMNSDNNNKVHWYISLPLALHSMNSTVNKKTGFSPLQLMFWREPTSILFNPVPENVDVHDVDSWAEHVHICSNGLRELINQKAIEYNQEKSKALDDQRKLDKLEVGEVVYKENIHRLTSSKSEPYCHGPFIIHKLDNEGNAYLKTPLGHVLNQKVARVHLHKADHRYKDDAMIAESIIEVTGRVPQRNFRIRFKGYGADADVWMDERRARHLRIFSDYNDN